MNFVKKHRKRQLGPVEKKILILLAAGASLALTHRPDYSFRILDAAAKEWKKINQRSLREAIRRLYQSKLIDYKEKGDGVVALALSEGGEKRRLEYSLDDLEIKKPRKWDGSWRMVLFDIPEYKKRARDALAKKLKELGFYQLQKSVFIYPYECKNEIDFIVEIFDLRPFVRFVTVKEIDVDLDLKNRFSLL